MASPLVLKRRDDEPASARAMGGPEAARRAHYARSIQPSAGICGVVIKSLAAADANGWDAKRATTTFAFGATQRPWPWMPRASKARRTPE